MNYSAYLAAGQMITLMQSFSKIRIVSHGHESIPTGSIIFVVNHFTRIETLLLPYHIYSLMGVPVWSLADQSFFEGPFSGFLEKVGAVSTRNPDRDKLIVKSLLVGEANWIIFPEGKMVKNKEAEHKSSIFSLHRNGGHFAHTGAATLALRTEFYRKRLRHLQTENPDEADRLLSMFHIRDLAPVLEGKTWIVPINLTYYPLRSHENILSMLADRFARTIPDRLREELLTEGSMFFDGVDIDIRFGKAIPVSESLQSPIIRRDILSKAQINFDDRLPSLQYMRRMATELMHRFMTDIYTMTTVNHDHLFASLLRALPLGRISGIDFRRRIFLLTQSVTGKTSVFCHQSLETSQVALLTDDRYHKFSDFLQLALETGVIRYVKDQLIRIDVNFSAENEFHRIRFENPLMVLINEVKPLAALQSQIRWMAWQSEMLVRHQITELLLQQVSDQFNADYSRFCLSGGTGERSSGEAILLKGTSRRLGVVLFHDLLATPREMLALAAHLNDRGYWVYSARVRGHGTAPEDLAIRTGHDWLESVDIGYAIMSSICRRVVVGGFSFGGGLAMDFAARMGRSGLSGVFSVSSPFRLQNFSTRFASTITAWNRVMDTANCHGATLEYVDITPERPHISYARIPVAALLEMELFMKNLEPRLPHITVPTLVVQGYGDPFVNPEGTALMYNRIGAKQKRYIPFDFDRHCIVAGAGSEHVHDVIADFIASL